VGLAGELRAVSQCESRLKEAERLGFKRGVISSGNMERVKNCQMELYGAKHIEEAIEFIFR
jgi:DNA repair protein RadA/Sms